MPTHWAAEVSKAAWSTSHVLMAISKRNWLDCSCSQTMHPSTTATNLTFLCAVDALMCVQLNAAAFSHWKIAWVMEAPQPMTWKNRAYRVNNHTITCNISKHNHACSFAFFDSNDSIIFPLLCKWQIPQPMRPRFAISPSEVLHNEPCYRWWEARQLEQFRTTNKWIRVRLFEQRAIFRVDFFSRGKRRKIRRYTGVGQSKILYIYRYLLYIQCDIFICA